MPRNMSFALTTEQILNKTKTVTRRQGWNKLKAGDLIQPVEKGMGLKKGEKVKKIGGLIRVVRIDREPIASITEVDCCLEGFPDFSPSRFIDMYCRHNKVIGTDLCNRIEFEYV